MIPDIGLMIGCRRSHENGFLLDQKRRQGRIYSCESFGCHYSPSQHCICVMDLVMHGKPTP